MKIKEIKKLTKDQVLKNITDIKEWHNDETLKKIGNVGWSKSILYTHGSQKSDFNSKFFRRLAYDEILANLLVLSQVRKRIKKFKKIGKVFDDNISKKLIDNFNFKLTKNQIDIIKHHLYLHQLHQILEYHLLNVLYKEHCHK